MALGLGPTVTAATSWLAGSIWAYPWRHLWPPRSSLTWVQVVAHQGLQGGVLGSQVSSHGPDSWCLARSVGNSMKCAPSEWLLCVGGGRMLSNMSSGDIDGFRETVAQEPLEPGGIYLA